MACTNPTLYVSAVRPRSQNVFVCFKLNIAAPAPSIECPLQPPLTVLAYITTHVLAYLTTHVFPYLTTQRN